MIRTRPSASYSPMIWCFLSPWHWNRISYWTAATRRDETLVETWNEWDESLWAPKQRKLLEQSSHVDTSKGVYSVSSWPTTISFCWCVLSVVVTRIENVNVNRRRTSVSLLSNSILSFTPHPFPLLRLSHVLLFELQWKRTAAVGRLVRRP